MSEMTRVQRWRQQQRAAGKDALTIWLPRELKLYVEDMALKRHCSPSDLVEQALTTCYPLSADVTDTVTDTHVTDMSQIRLMLQQELRAFLGDIHLSQGIAPAQPVTDTVTDTSVQAEAVRAAIDIPYVTDTVTDTHGYPVPEGAMDHQGGHVTDSVTDTSAQTEAERVAIRALQGVTDTITDTSTEPALSVTDTVTDTDGVTDTVTVTSHALEPFDTTRYRLGKLCPKGHAFDGTGQSLLRQHNQRCRECENESRREKRQARRQGQAPEQRPGGALPATVPPYDPTTRRLGKLCPRGHDYHGTGQSLRTTHKSGYCLACNAERIRERRQATAPSRP